MWRNLFKYREIVKKFYKVEVNGEKIFFWYEVWLFMGCLRDVLSDGSCIGIGIQIYAIMVDSRNYRRRVYRNRFFNRVEDEIERYKVNLIQEEDISLWRNEKGNYKRRFIIRDIWLNIRENYFVCYWYKVVWFKYVILKYLFINWIVIQGRLFIGERMKRWNDNVDVVCVLC